MRAQVVRHAVSDRTAMTDYGRQVRFGYFLIPNVADPLLVTAQEVERLGTTSASRTTLTSGVLSTPGRCWR